LLRSTALWAAVDLAATADVAGVATSDATGISGEALDAAARYATIVTRHVFEQATRTALRYRFAKAANTPSGRGSQPVRQVHSASRAEPPSPRDTRAPETTWQPFAGDADPDHDHRPDAAERRHLPDTAYALPAQQKLPVTDAGHVRAAPARFDQVAGITDAERDLAFANLRKATAHYVVEVVAER
jgi:hypothetical protein